MFARVATFEIPQDAPPEMGEKVVAEVKRRMTEDPIPGATRVMIMGDPSAGRAVNITLFESEEAMREAEQIFEDMQPVAPEGARGRRLDVAHYRVMLDEQVR